VNAAARIDWPAWWQIFRAANVFTAISNVIAGFLLIQGNWQPLGPLLLLMLTSALLYDAGMVLNDVCDAILDAKERPERPIPSGRISRQTALRAGLSLLIGGVACGGLAAWISGQIAACLVTLMLAGMVVVYNVRGKSTPFGPLNMGLCRFLNVCLGASISPALTDSTVVWLFAWGVFFHTYGLTRIARQETDSIDNVDLWVGCASVLLAIVWIASLAVGIDEPQVSLLVWALVCSLLLGWELQLVYKLVANPTQGLVRQTVGRLIKSFILIDAAVATLAAGWSAGLIVLAFLIPTQLMSRRIAMT
jgi:hypothetical protein